MKFANSVIVILVMVVILTIFGSVLYGAHFLATQDLPLILILVCLLFCGFWLREVLVLAALASFGLISFRLVDRYLEASSVVVVSDILDDQHGVFSILLKNEIEKEFQKIGAKAIVARSKERFQPISLKNSEHYSRLIVSGAKSNLFILLGDTPKTAIVGDINPIFTENYFGRLILIRDIPSFAMPLRPLTPTAQFLARLTVALFLPVAEDQELALRDATRVIARWNSFSHYGYVLFLRGNLLFERALKEPLSAKGLITCARVSYLNALSKLHGSKQLFLRSAIVSNLTLLNIFAGLLEGEEKFDLKSQQRLTKAVSLLATKSDDVNSLHLRSIIKENILFAKRIGARSRLIKNSNSL
ncbi:MAG TPA: hypothetical protein PKD37_08005 [Oligoflexia bacterium]|nr:hypothetical protein [Oligoflexia bacterium]HMP27906.1 hypothetical protein [Oligoflexia bacterium]